MKFHQIYLLVLLGHLLLDAVAGTKSLSFQRLLNFGKRKMSGGGKCVGYGGVGVDPSNSFLRMKSWNWKYIIV